MLAALDDRTPRAAAIRHSVPRVAGGAVVGRARARGRRGRCWRRSTSPPRRRCGSTRCGPIRPSVRARLPVASRPAPGLPEGLVLEAPFDVHGSELSRRRGDHGPVAGVDARRRGSSTRSPASGCSTCAPPRAARRPTSRRWPATRAGSSPSSATPAARRRCARTCERMGATSVAVRVADAAEPRACDGALRPGARRPAVQRPRDAALAAGPPLADEPRARSPSSPALGARILDAAAAAPRPGAVSSTPCARSPAPRGPDRSRRSSSAIPISPPRIWPPRWPGVGDPAAAPYLQLRPDLDGTDGFFIARLRRDGRPAAG